MLGYPCQLNRSMQHNLWWSLLDATKMMERISEASPRLMARVTGALYLVVILTGIFARGFVSGRLVD
jgi:hypothetical protein